MRTSSENGTADALRPTRVVVLVDASPDARHALETAVGLARRHGTPLLAVTVEEPDSVRSAAYSFAREIGALSGAIRSFEPARPGHRGERGATTIGRAIEQALGRLEVEWDRVVLRGRLVEEVLALSRPGDLLLLGRVGWSARLGRKLGRAPLVLARRSGATVQICSARPAGEGGRIAVLVEDVEASNSLLAVAAERARAARSELVVLLAPAAGDPDTAGRVAEALQGMRSKWRLRVLPSLGTGETLRALAEERAVELLVRRGGDWLDSPAAARLLALWHMPVLVMGEPSG